MRLLDVNVLLYAYFDEAAQHERYRAWLEDLLDAEEPFALADVVLSGFIRLATHPRVFDPPVSVEDAFAFVDVLLGASNAVRISPGERHWSLFERLCREGGARGNLVADAYLAALAIESGSELITADRDFARFAGLRWAPPFA
jgi:toxin-antitoxin system PIN domain toxin